MGEVDPAFIQEPEHRPKLSIIEAEGIPLIDLSPLNASDPKAIEGLVREISNACKDWGFFQVINHGVPLDKREKIEIAARKFFALSLEEKRKIRRDEENVVGYNDTDHTKNVRDWKEVFDFLVEEPILVPASNKPGDKEETQWFNQWPESPPQFRVACEEYAREVEKLALKLMGLIALSLGLPEGRFKSYFKDQTSVIRLNHYPLCPSPQLALGIGRHKDSGALTVLAQDEVGGLEVKRKTDGEWIRVKPTPNAYIINVADTIQVWSNDKYESVEHRVIVNSEKERFSVALFLNPALYTQVKPLEELTNKQNPAKYMPYSWERFITHRLLSNFKKLKAENIQIYHFRVWSNDRYESVEHRVMVNSDKERFSTPFFFNPAHYTAVVKPVEELINEQNPAKFGAMTSMKPLEELLNDENPAKYREYNWGKFFATRNRSDFKKLDVDNIQIHHYRISR